MLKSTFFFQNKFFYLFTEIDTHCNLVTCGEKNYFRNMYMKERNTKKSYDKLINAITRRIMIREY